MAKPYASEMGRLAQTLAWSAEADIGPLKQALRTAALWPLRAIGSGGSLSAAHALAQLHQHYSGKLASVATPLEAIEEPLGADVGAWLISAGGSNVDVLAAAKVLIAREPRQLGVICGRAESALGELCAAHPFVDCLIYPPPAGKDGFLATNSLLGFCALMQRAYSAACDGGASWARVHAAIAPLTDVKGESVARWKDATDALWARETTLVLYGAGARLGAIDLESKFTEAALGNLQLADYRNFAHGRHHWLAKRGDKSAVLAFVSEADRALAQRTLALIPADIPRAEIDLPEGGEGLGSLIAALWITLWAGRARGIDPGDPGVPAFGRKLYHLPLGRAAARPAPSRADDAALMRKTSAIQLDAYPPAWRAHLIAYRERLEAQIFNAIVLDYDGTIVDARERRAPPGPEMAAELERLIDAGCMIGFATGRGASVRRDLKASLARACWKQVIVGYYNGGDIAPLTDDDAPNGAQATDAVLAPIAAALRQHLALVSGVSQADRPRQITLEYDRPPPDGRLWDLVQDLVRASGVEGVEALRSGHSIDIVAPGVSKLNVIQRVRETIADAVVLTIGDRGRWPGNDHELLGEPYALSVDETPADPARAWNLAPPGQRGVAAALQYLRALERVDAGGVRFREGAFA